MAIDRLFAENADLRRRLDEAEETIAAIQAGAVDAFVVDEPEGRRVYTLEGADRPYRLLVEEMQQGAATLSADGQISYCNRRLAELLRVPQEHLVGAVLRSFVADEDAQVYDSLLREGLGGSGRGEARLKRRESAPAPAFLTFNALPKDCGAAIGVLVTDLTSQKLHEQLHASEEALRNADRRKNEFLAMLAHELRNPLAPVRNAVKIVRLNPDDSRTVSAMSEMMERQVDHMIRLIDDLLDVSRITRGRIELRCARIELQSAVNHAVESVRPLSERLGHRLSVSLPPEPIWLDADRTRLAQILGNLLSNACKFTRSSGELSLDVQRRSGEALIRLRDNGIGIAAGDLPRIFDMFMQADTALERSVSGLGIGLTLVKTLVELHGGRIAVRSEGLGRGTEFTVRLPLAAREADRAAGKPVEAPSAIGPLRILVVDDNRDSAESMALLLQLEGHETHVAHDGLEAVAAAEARRPDVVLLDIGLPRLNGYEAARRIRAQTWGRSMLLAALTGWGQEEDLSRSSEAGFDAHLVKPVDWNALHKLLGSVRGRLVR